MKICVTSQGPSLDSDVDGRFGRCAFFVVIDMDSMEVNAISNEATHAASGAGIAAATTVIDSGAEAVLTGDCGPKAFRTLQAGNVTVYTGVKGPIRDAIDLFNHGKLQPANEASV